MAYLRSRGSWPVAQPRWHIDHLLDHKQSAAGLDDHQVIGAETLGELQMK
jgi:Uri superfamily endonuclease